MEFIKIAGTDTALSVIVYNNKTQCNDQYLCVNTYINIFFSENGNREKYLFESFHKTSEKIVTLSKKSTDFELQPIL